MSIQLDAKAKAGGTRFRLFAQPRHVRGFEAPELVHVNVPARGVTSGPADDRMYVVDAIGKLPYDADLPPYRGMSNPPVQPRDGHFDHLEIGTRGFACASMYASARRVLDIWEDYLGHRIEWHFRGRFQRLELIPLLDWDNAQAGFGFLELGYARLGVGGRDYDRPLCARFDAVADALGHAIVASQLGAPRADAGGLREATCTLVALLALLHFDTVVDQLLASSKGNLFTANELTRLGELGACRPLRLAFNDLRLADAADPAAAPEARAQPLIGAIFDILVEQFQKNLIDEELITQELAERAVSGPGQGVEVDYLRQAFGRAHTGNEAGFRTALLKARDTLGRLVACSWSKLPPDDHSCYAVLVALLDADRELFAGANQASIRGCFAWRQIATPADPLLLRPHRLDAGALAAAWLAGERTPDLGSEASGPPPARRRA